MTELMLILSTILIIAALVSRAINRYFAIREKQAEDSLERLRAIVDDSVSRAMFDDRQISGARIKALQDRLDKLNIEKLKQQVAKLSVQNGFKVDND